MSFAIRKSQQENFIKAKPRKNGNYLAFLHRLPCAMTGARRDIEAAHLSFASPRHGHYGRAKATKAPDRWALPLCREEHARQHTMSEQQYWAGRDPHLLALTIYGLWTDLGDDAEPFAEAIINQGIMS